MTHAERTSAWPDDVGAERATRLLADTFGVEADGVWAAPGRVNLIGEHLDYNGGPSLPFALPHRTFVALRARDDDSVRVVSDVAATQPWVGRLADIRPGGVTGWMAYAAGPAWALQESGHRVGGFDAAIVSCVPLGAGLSSSAAVGCSMALAVDEAFGLGLAAAGEPGRTSLAAACVRAENDVAGAPTGGMDQAASLLCHRGAALLLDPARGGPAQVPFDAAAAGLAVLVIDTRASHSLSDGQYALRRSVCEAAADRLGVRFLAEVTDLAAALAALDDAQAPPLVRHVVTETHRTREVADLLRDNRIRDIGPLLTASHASLRDDYRVSCDELDVAVDVALSSGALGARMTGGGFGGSAIALLPAAAVGAAADAVTAAYRERGWKTPEFHLALPSQGAQRVG